MFLEHNFSVMGTRCCTAAGSGRCTGSGMAGVRERRPREGGLLARLPRDVRWAMLAAVAVVLLSLYEEWPTTAMLLGLAFTGFIVARIITRD